MGNDRIEVLKLVTHPFNGGTAFAVGLNGDIMSITAKHLTKCGNSCAENIFEHKDLDVSIIAQCPPVKFALNGLNYVIASQGDDAYVRGYSSLNNFQNHYRAYIGGDVWVVCAQWLWNRWSCNGICW